MIGGVRHAQVVVAVAVLMSAGCTSGADEASSVATAASDVATTAEPTVGARADDVLSEDDTLTTDGATERSTEAAAPRRPLSRPGPPSAGSPWVRRLSSPSASMRHSTMSPSPRAPSVPATSQPPPGTAATSETLAEV